VSAAGSQTIKVLVIDDRRAAADALEDLLRSQDGIEVVGAVSGPRLEDVIRGRALDVALVDFFTVMRTGATRVIAAVRAEHPDATIVLRTHSDDPATIAACVEAGAVGYVGDAAPPTEVIAAIKRAHAGEVLFTRAELTRMLEQGRAGPPSSDREQPLDPVEVEVLRALGNGLSSIETAQQLGITVLAVQRRLAAARRRLAARSNTHAVLLAFRSGLFDLAE
jgi:DNA-binding NarL/FixJ family response regulator